MSNGEKRKKEKIRKRTNNKAIKNLYNNKPQKNWEKIEVNEWNNLLLLYSLVDGITMAHVHKTSRYIQLQQYINKIIGRTYYRLSPI